MIMDYPCPGWLPHYSNNAPLSISYAGSEQELMQRLLILEPALANTSVAITIDVERQLAYVHGVSNTTLLKAIGMAS